MPGNEEDDLDRRDSFALAREALRAMLVVVAWRRQVRTPALLFQTLTFDPLGVIRHRSEPALPLSPPIAAAPSGTIWITVPALAWLAGESGVELRVRDHAVIDLRRKRGRPATTVRWKLIEAVVNHKITHPDAPDAEVARALGVPAHRVRRAIERVTGRCPLHGEGATPYVAAP